MATKKAKPRRTKSRRELDKHIPMSTDADAAEVDQLLELWRDLAGKSKWRRARAVIGRMLTTQAEDL